MHGLVRIQYCYSNSHLELSLYSAFSCPSGYSKETVLLISGVDSNYAHRVEMHPIELRTSSSSCSFDFESATCIGQCIGAPFGSLVEDRRPWSQPKGHLENSP